MFVKYFFTIIVKIFIFTQKYPRGSAFRNKKINGRTQLNAFSGVVEFP